MALSCRAGRRLSRQLSGVKRTRLSFRRTAAFDPTATLRERRSLRLIVSLPMSCRPADKLMRFGHKAGSGFPLYLCQRVGERDAHSAIFAFAARRRSLAGRDAFCRKHLFLLHTDTDAPPAREAASAYMHTNRTSAPSWRIGIRNAAFVAHRVDSDDNGTSVAYFSFQKVSQSRLVFHEKLESDCN